MEESESANLRCNLCGESLENKIIMTNLHQLLICLECFEKDSFSIDGFYYPEIDQISEKIFLGNAQTQKNKALLKVLNVTHIIVAGKELNIHYPNDFTYLKLSLEDDEMENISQHFDATYNFIEGCQSAVYVHCMAGVSRSPSIVIAYLMRKEGISYVEARKLVVSKRPFIYPNDGFVRQLQEFEKKLRKKQKEETFTIE